MKRSKQKILIGFFLVSCFLILIPPISAHAQSSITQALFPPCTADGSCGFQDAFNIVQGMTRVLTDVAFVVAPLLFTYAGWILLSEGDNPGARKKAYKIFQNTVVGFGIMMLAWVIVNFVIVNLVCGVTPGNWLPDSSKCPQSQ